MSLIMLMPFVAIAVLAIATPWKRKRPPEPPRMLIRRHLLLLIGGALARRHNVNIDLLVNLPAFIVIS